MELFPEEKTEEKSEKEREGTRGRESTGKERGGGHLLLGQVAGSTAAGLERDEAANAWERRRPRTKDDDGLRCVGRLGRGA